MCCPFRCWKRPELYVHAPSTNDFRNMNFSLNESGTGSTESASLSNNHDVLWNRFLVVCLLSAIYLSFLSVLTTLSNGVLLVALYQDPFKVFRQPPTVFITGLALADFLTGVAVNPLFAYFYFEVYRDNISSEHYNNILKAAGILSSVTMNVSFLTILFLSWTQFIAISFPHRHKQLVTGKRVVICVCGIWVYSLLFFKLASYGRTRKNFSKNRCIPQPYTHTCSCACRLYCTTCFVQTSNCTINALAR